MTSTKTKNKKDDLEAAFDAGKELDVFFDFNNPAQPNRELKRVNVDFPQWMIDGLDAEAARLGINRQAVIKTWLAEKLDEKAEHKIA